MVVTPTMGWPLPAGYTFRQKVLPAKLLKNSGNRLVSLVDQKAPERSLLVTKPTQRVEHTGGQRVMPGSEEEKLLLLWVKHLAAVSTSQPSLSNEKDPEPQPVFMSRLTHSQYNNTVRDLLGDETRPADQFPQEDYVRGFKNQSEVQSIPLLLAEAYSAAAEKLARNTFRTSEWKKIVPCQPASSGDCRVPQPVYQPFREARLPKTAHPQRTAAIQRIVHSRSQEDRQVSLRGSARGRDSVAVP